jgi:hypothetical protein
MTFGISMLLTQSLNPGENIDAAYFLVLYDSEINDDWLASKYTISSLME